MTNSILQMGTLRWKVFLRLDQLTPLAYLIPTVPFQPFTCYWALHLNLPYFVYLFSEGGYILEILL